MNFKNQKGISKSIWWVTVQKFISRMWTKIYNLKIILEKRLKDGGEVCLICYKHSITGWKCRNRYICRWTDIFVDISTDKIIDDHP